MFKKTKPPKSKANFKVLWVFYPQIKFKPRLASDHPPLPPQLPAQSHDVVNFVGNPSYLRVFV
jgi:hypothetical protein